jgi:anhydro-N-acetylmuramic acid kinase
LRKKIATIGATCEEKAMRIIGNMTGNSMDAVDLVVTDFEGGTMHDVCSFTRPYDKAMQNDIESLRKRVHGLSKEKILSLQDFKEIHNRYVCDVADCINEMCLKNQLDKKTIAAVGFHGKTLDHNPPSRAALEGTTPYTLQIGSGKMLADLTGLTVVYDFRSAPIKAGLEGAPLVAAHNAHIAKTEGDAVYYNGGNTANFAVVSKHRAVLAADAGPFNEYIDSRIRLKTDLPFDVDGQIGAKGVIDTDFTAFLFQLGRAFYERPLPKSGDPSYYRCADVTAYIEAHRLPFENAVRTLEYFAAYVAFQALTLIDGSIALPNVFRFFGGGWHNPITRSAFDDLLHGRGFVLPEHKKPFKKFLERFEQMPTTGFSAFGQYTEARLFADMAYFRLKHRPWPMPETDKPVLCGQIARPVNKTRAYDDMINAAAKE